MNYFFKDKFTIENWLKSTKSVSQFEKDIIFLIKEVKFNYHFENILANVDVNNMDDVDKMILLLEKYNFIESMYYIRLKIILSISSIIDNLPIKEQISNKDHIHSLLSYVNLDKVKIILSQEFRVFMSIFASNKQVYLSSIKYLLIKNKNDMINILLPLNSTNFDISLYLPLEVVSKEAYQILNTYQIELFEKNNLFIFLFYVNLTCLLEQNSYKIKEICSIMSLNSSIFKAFYNIYSTIASLIDCNNLTSFIQGITNQQNQLFFDYKSKDFENIKKYFKLIENFISIYCLYSSVPLLNKENYEKLYIQTFYNMSIHCISSDHLINYINDWIEINNSLYLSYFQQIKSICLSNIIYKTNFESNLTTLISIITKDETSKEADYLIPLLKLFEHFKEFNVDIGVKVLKEILINNFTSSQSFDFLKEFLTNLINNLLQGSFDNKVSYERLLKKSQDIIQIILTKNYFNIEELLLQQIKSLPIGKTVNTKKNLFSIIFSRFDFFVNNHYSFSESFYGFLIEIIKNVDIKSKIHEFNIEELKDDKEIQSSILSYKNNNSGAIVFSQFYLKYKNYIMLIHFLDENKFNLDLLSFDQFSDLSKADLIKILINKKYKINQISSVEKFINMTTDFYEYFNIKVDEYIYYLFQMFFNNKNKENYQQCLILLSFRKEYSLYHQKCILIILDSNENIDFDTDELVKIKLLLVENTNNKDLIRILSTRSVCSNTNTSIRCNSIFDNRNSELLIPNENLLISLKDYLDKNAHDSKYNQSIDKDKSKLYNIDPLLAKLFEEGKIEYKSKEFDINTKINFRISLFKKLIYNDYNRINDIMKIEQINSDNLLDDIYNKPYNYVTFSMMLYNKNINITTQMQICKDFFMNNENEVTQIIHYVLTSFIKINKTITFSNIKFIYECLSKERLFFLDNIGLEEEDYLRVLESISILSNKNFNYLALISSELLNNKGNNTLIDKYNENIVKSHCLSVLLNSLFYKEAKLRSKAINQVTLNSFVLELFQHINTINYHGFKKIINILNRNDELSYLIEMILGLSIVKKSLKLKIPNFITSIKEVIQLLKKLNIFNDESKLMLIIEDIITINDLSYILDGNQGLFILETSINDSIKNSFTNKINTLNIILDIAENNTYKISDKIINYIRDNISIHKAYLSTIDSMKPNEIKPFYLQISN